MKLGPFEISFEMMAILTLFVFTTWLGFQSGVFTKKTFWRDFAKGFLRVAVIVLVEQGLIFRAYLIEPAYLNVYNWVGFLGGLAYIIFILNPRSDEKVKNE